MKELIQELSNNELSEISGGCTCWCTNSWHSLGEGTRSQCVRTCRDIGESMKSCN